MVARQTRQVISELDYDRGSGLPLAHRVADGLGRLIEDGELAAGKKLPPTGELAELVGVSRQVAQDALALMVERNQVRRKPRLGTMVLERPNGQNCALWAVVAEWLPLRSNFGWLVMQEFVRRADARGLQHREYVSVRSRDGGVSLPQSLREDLRSERIDALFLSAVHPSAVRREMPSESVPLMLLDVHMRKEAVLKEAVNWLADAGCDSVGLAYHGGSDDARDEMRSFCRETGMSMPDKWVVADLASSAEAGRQLLHRLYPEGDAGPDGLVILDDLVAYGFSEESRETGRGPQPARLVVQENRGSSLPLPDESPRIQLDWGRVVEAGLDRFQIDGDFDTDEFEVDAFRFQAPVDSGRAR